MIQQCSLATYQRKPSLGAAALLVRHEPQHQAGEEIERGRNGGRGVQPVGPLAW